MRLKCSGQVTSDEIADLYRRNGYALGYHSPGAVREAVAALAPGEELVLEINSVGGSICAANEIYSVLEGCGNPTRAEIQSLAASAASYYIMACDRVTISLPAQMMIHRASTVAWGNEEELLQAVRRVQVTDESMLNVYCRRCGEERREELRLLMEQESFLGAQRCLELGLVDEIIGEVLEVPTAAEPMPFSASAGGNVFRAMNFLPSPAALLRGEGASTPNVRAQTVDMAYRIQEARAALARERSRYQ